jgi:hemerythrin superfamily protein
MPGLDASVAKKPSVRQVKGAGAIKDAKNAIALLQADHREVDRLFESFGRSKSAADRQTLAKKICQALRLHTRIEEEIFYPAFLEATGNREMHNEALVEHQGVRRLIEEIESSVAGDPLFDARITVLCEMIEHHVEEEEGSDGMFTQARRSKMDLTSLGVLLEVRKQELARGTHD